MLCPASAHAQGGVPLWTNSFGDGSFGDGGRSCAMRLAADSSGNVIVTACCGTVKYSAAGAPLWTNLFGGTCVAVDKSDNVFVAAGVRNAQDDLDYVTIKFSKAGVPLWTNRYDEPAGFIDFVVAIAVDGAGNVLVTGNSRSRAGGVVRDHLTIKYSNSGVPVWTNRYNELGGFNEVHGIAVDSSGNAFVTGYSGGDYTDADYATVAYSSGGDLLWSQSVRRAGELSRSYRGHCGRS